MPKIEPFYTEDWKKNKIICRLIYKLTLKDYENNVF